VTVVEEARENSDGARRSAPSTVKARVAAIDLSDSGERASDSGSKVLAAVRRFGVEVLIERAGRRGFGLEALMVAF
jgi:hypothetical protein